MNNSPRERETLASFCGLAEGVISGVTDEYISVDVSNHSLITISIHYFHNTTTVSRERGKKEGHADVHPPFFLQQLEEKEPIRTRGCRGRAVEWIPYTRAFSGRTIDFGIRWQFFKPMANNYRILPPSSGFRYKRSSPSARAIKRPSTHGFTFHETAKILKKYRTKIFRIDPKLSRFFPLRSCSFENREFRNLQFARL